MLKDEIKKIIMKQKKKHELINPTNLELGS